MNKLWKFLHAKNRIPEEHSTPSGSLGMPLGILERGLYTGALMIGTWQLIGAWLLLKTAAKWKITTQHKGADNAWLIGNGLSLAFGFIGAWIALWHLPIVK